MEFPTHIIWMSPTFIFSGIGSNFSFFYEIRVCKQISPRWDAAFCGVTSGAILFAFVPSKGRQAFWVEFDPNSKRDILFTGNLERAWTLSVKNDRQSMSVQLRYWIVKSISRDKARPLVSRLYFERSFT